MEVDASFEKVHKRQTAFLIVHVKLGTASTWRATETSRSQKYCSSSCEIARRAPTPRECIAAVAQTRDHLQAPSQFNGCCVSRGRLAILCGPEPDAIHHQQFQYVKEPCGHFRTVRTSLEHVSSCGYRREGADPCGADQRNVPGGLLCNGQLGLYLHRRPKKLRNKDVFFPTSSQLFLFPSPDQLPTSPISRYPQEIKKKKTAGGLITSLLFNGFPSCFFYTGFSILFSPIHCDTVDLRTHFLSRTYATEIPSLHHVAIQELVRLGLRPLGLDRPSLLSPRLRPARRGPGR